MIDINKVILAGRLGANPVQKETKSGRAFTRFSVATSRKIKKSASTENGADDETTEETQWHHIVAWGKQAESCKQYLSKGRPVLIEGSLRHRKFEDSEGRTRYMTEVHADTVSFLGSRPKNSVIPVSEDEIEQKSA